MDRGQLALALLLAVPPGVSVTMGILMMAGDRVSTPLAAGVGVATAVGLFLVVAAGVSGSGPDEMREPGDTGS